MNFNDIDKNDYDERTFGECIRERREELGYTLRSVANDINISAAYLSDIEKGNRRVPSTKKNIEILKNLKKILEIREEELESFYDMAYASRGYYKDIEEYLKNHKKARLALNMAKDLELPDEFFQGLINQLIELKEEEKRNIKLKYEYIFLDEIKKLINNNN